MINTRTLKLGICLSIFAVLFQLVPMQFSNGLIVITLLSTLPIFIISRINSRIGLVAYFCAGIVILLIDPNSGIIFLLTNGILGYTLGIWYDHFYRKKYVLLLCGIVLTITLCVLNFTIGIPFLSADFSLYLVFQILILFVITIIYILLYMNFAQFVFKTLNKYCYLDCED